jgi:cell division FtsZ-interacting protein ZapD
MPCQPIVVIGFLNSSIHPLASIDSRILKSGRSCYFQLPPEFIWLDYATTEKESAKTIPDYFIASSSEHLPTMAALVQRNSRHNH